MNDESIKPFLKFFKYLLLIEVPFLLWFFIQWCNTHGFFGGLWHWLKHGNLDPIYGYAEIDFLVLQLALGCVIVKDWTRIRPIKHWSFVIFLGFYLLAPSAAFMSFYIYKNRPRLSSS